MLRRVIPDVVDNQNLLTIVGTESVLAAARCMAERKVRSILVVDRDRLIGVFTGTDMIGRVVAAGLSPENTAVAQVMTPDPVTIGPETLAIEALRLMQEGGYRHLPIVEDGRLLGIVSRKDFWRDEEAEIEREERLWERL